MTVLVDIRPLASGVLSGVERYATSLLSHLLEGNAGDRYVLFFNRFRGKRLPREWDFLARVPTINWHVPNKLLEIYERVVGEPKVDRFIRADVIFSPHFNLLCTTARARRVITIHDLSPLRYPHFFPPRKRFWHWMQDIRGQARRAARLIAVSESTRRDIIETLGVAPERVTTVHSGVAPFFTHLPGDDAELREFRGAHDLAKPFILFEGTLEPRKNIPALIGAFNRLKSNPAHRDLSLVLVGRPGWLYDGVAVALRRSPHRSDIRLWGAASDGEVRSLYNLAAVFVYPSFYEGFGFPVLEAQACGAPVVASNTSSLPEILGGSALLVDPADHGALADAIRRVLENEPFRRELCEKGFENVRRFSWERAARETRSVFEEACAA